MGIGVFLYSCMFLQYYLLEGWLFFYVYIFHVGHSAVAYFNVESEKLFKYGKIRIRFCPHGYNQKRKLFHTNSFMFAHSSAKKNYNEQLTLKSSIHFNVTSFSPCWHTWLACICLCACICLLHIFICISEHECCFTKAIINFCFWVFFVWCDTCFVFFIWCDTWKIRFCPYMGKHGQRKPQDYDQKCKPFHTNSNAT